jgi:hypothetical protein
MAVIGTETDSVGKAFIIRSFQVGQEDIDQRNRYQPAADQTNPSEAPIDTARKKAIHER